MRRDVVRAARARAASPDTWVYAFSWVSPTRHWAMHCLDVPFFFDVLGAPQVDRVAGPNPPESLARAYHGAALSFIREGRVDWRRWSDGDVARVFDGAGTHDSRRAYAGLMPLV
jgi:para-nitrobenzyl esterase